MMKNIFITGASHGVGKAIAEKFAANGFNIAMCCHTDFEILKNFADELAGKYKVSTLPIKCDVSSYESVKDAVKKAKEFFGPEKIDVLINNAGISFVGLFQDTTPDIWEKVIGTNLSSVYNTCHLFMDDFLKKKNGKIINVSSVWGDCGASCEVAYCASKGGINSFTKALAKELAPSHITVNAVALGVIDTRMNGCFSDEEKEDLANEIPVGRFASTKEAADMIYKLYEMPEYLTGKIISFDGGWI